MVSKGKKKKKKESGPCSDVPGGRWHSKEDGKFTSPDDDDACWSLYDSCPEGGRSRTKKGSKKRYAISAPATSGRAPGRTHKCSTNQKLTKEMLRTLVEEVLQEVEPRKTDLEKRKTRDKWEREKRKDNRRKQLGRDSIHDEIEKQTRPFKQLAAGIYEADKVEVGLDVDGSRRELEIKLNTIQAIISSIEQGLGAPDGLLSKEAGELVEDDESAELLYKKHSGDRDRKRKVQQLRKKLCPKPQGKPLNLQSLVRQLNAIALSMKGKLNAPKKASQ